MMSNFLDKFHKWNRDRKYRKGKYYEIYHEPSVYENDNVSIAFRLLKGKYKDVVFTIGKIQIGETLSDGSAKANFDIEIIQQPTKLKGDLTLREDFNRITGDILLVVLEDAIKAADERMNSLEQELHGAENEFDQDRANYIEEPVQKRTVRKKDSSVSKKRVLPRKSRKNSI
jgi:hypothetical protein